MSRRLAWTFLGLIVTFGAGLRADLRLPLEDSGINQPWERGHRGVLGGGYFSVLTRTFDRLGPGELRLGPAFAEGDVFPEPILYCTHHPPLMSLSLWAWTKMVGRSELTMRLWPFLFSVGFLVLLYGFASSMWGRGTGLAAAAIASFLPMAASYGHFVSYEPLVACFSLGSLWALLRWHRSGCAGFLGLGILLMGVGAFVDWPGYFVPPAIALAILLAPRRRRLLPAAGFLSLGLLYFGLFSLFCTWSLGAHGESTWIGFLEEFRAIVLDTSTKGTTVTAAMWWEAHQEFYGHFFRPLPLILAGFGLAGLLGTWLVGRPRDDDAGGAREVAFSVALVVPALLNILFFWHNAHGHDFHTYYSIAPIALWGGWFVTRAAAAASRRFPGASPLLPAGICLALLVPAGVDGARHVAIEYARTRTTAYRDLGSFIEEQTPRDALVLCSKKVTPSLYYADRGIMIDPVKTLADLKVINGFCTKHGLVFKEVYYVVTEDTAEAAEVMIGLCEGRAPLVEKDGFQLYRLPPPLVNRKLRKVEEGS